MFDRDLNAPLYTSFQNFQRFGNFDCHNSNSISSRKAMNIEALFNKYTFGYNTTKEILAQK